MIKNLTGHDLNIVSQNQDGKRTVTKTILSNGIARVAMTTLKVDTIDGIDIYETTFGETQGLPEYQSRYVADSGYLNEYGGDLDFSSEDIAWETQTCFRLYGNWFYLRTSYEVDLWNAEKALENGISQEDFANRMQNLGDKFIVSKIVAEANPHRDDLLIVSETVREGATIIGCKGLARLS